MGTPIVIALALCVSAERFQNREAVEVILGGVHFGLAINSVLIPMAAGISFMFLPKKVPGAASAPLVTA
jgi:hypothetical protein